MKTLGLSAIIFLCAAAACVQAGVVSSCSGKKWWWLSDQSVQVRDWSFSKTTVSIFFDEVFFSGGAHMVRRTELSKAVLSARGGFGFTELFSDKTKYMVLENSHYHVKKHDGFLWWGGHKNIESNYKLGTHIIEDGNLRYVYTAVLGGTCDKPPQ